MNKSWLTETAFAHRGLHGPSTGHVENTLSAFLSANSLKIGIELDVVLSKDHQAMVFHDATLDRLTNRVGAVGDFTAAELSQIPLIGTKDTILPLKMIMAKLGSRYPILVEIKGDQAAPDMIAAATARAIQGHQGPVAVMSFYPDVLKWFKANACHVLCGVVATSRNDGGLPDRYFNEDVQLSFMQEREVDFIAYDIRCLPNRVTEYCQSHHIPVLTWTVRSEQEKSRAACHADGPIFEITLP